MRRRRKTFVHQLDVFPGQRHSLPGVASIKPHRIGFARFVRLPLPDRVFKRRALCIHEQIRGPALVPAVDRLEILDLHHGLIAVPFNGPDQHPADFGSALGHRAKSAHHVLQNPVDHLQVQAHLHGLSRGFPNVVPGGVLCSGCHSS